MRALSRLAAVAIVLLASSVASAQFTYRPPGELVPGSGRGRADNTVYAPGIRFPIETAPAYPNSQVWGAGGLYGPAGGQCATTNYRYPWHDNYCESRSWSMPMCPSGNGHQGQDIRPSTCRDNYHWVVAVAAGRITSVGSYSVYLTTADGTRYDYLHMRSLQVGVGASVRAGQRIGKVSNNFGGSAPTTIHCHFNIRKYVRGYGTVYVPTYMSLIRSYQTLLGGGTNCTPSTEVCDGKDNDCDGTIDDGVKNACGGCGEVPAEVCDGKDNDCDGTVDEDLVCEREEVIDQSAVFAPAHSTDIDGDGHSDVCGRGAEGLYCHLARGPEWSGRMFALGALSDAAGFTDVSNYATLRMGDLNADGRADVCIRGNDAVSCWTSTGTGFGPAITGPAWSDATRWNRPEYFSTIRLMDIDGDGRDDLCGRTATDFRCFPSTGTGFGPASIGPAWSDARGFNAPQYYGSIRTGDLDGDGRHDVCARTRDGVECFRSDGRALVTRVAGPEWSDAEGWGKLEYWSTMRLADINGDGKADVCARGATGLQCHLSTGEGFATSPIVLTALRDAAGWTGHDNYSTLRLGDLNGDGAADVCARSNVGISCWLWTGTGFGPAVTGPALSDTAGWNEPENYRTIRLGDFTGDGRADLCARNAEGFSCWPSMGGSFGPRVELGDFADTEGWDEPRYHATLQFAGRCLPSGPEVCDGRDNDCNGAVDEVCFPTPDDAGMRTDAQSTLDGGGHAAGEHGGCGCTTTGHAPQAPWATLAGLCAWMALRDRRRRNAS